MEFFVDIIDIVNISRSTVHLGVSEPNLDDIYFISEISGKTEITNLSEITSGSLLFDGFGTIKLLPGKRFIIEESRINGGQLHNYVNKGLVRALFLTRTINNLTDRS
jgi:hypothetical protein